MYAEAHDGGLPFAPLVGVGVGDLRLLCGGSGVGGSVRKTLGGGVEEPLGAWGDGVRSRGGVLVTLGVAGGLISSVGRGVSFVGLMFTSVVVGVAVGLVSTTGLRVGSRVGSDLGSGTSTGPVGVGVGVSVGLSVDVGVGVYVGVGEAASVGSSGFGLR